MANIEKRGDSYRITVSCGYSADGSRQIKQKMTWKPSKPNLTPKQLEKQLQAAVAEFEQRCKNEGTVVACVKFEPFCEAYLNDVASRTLKPSTLAYYEQLKPRVYGQIGHLRLDRITPREIDKLIAFLCKERKSAKTVAVCKVDFRSLIQEHGYSQKRLAHDVGTNQQTLKDFGNGKPILWTTAEKIAALLECDAETVFEKIEKAKGLSPKTIKNYISFVSSVFDYAVRTRVISRNPCEHCTLPTITEPDRKMLSLDEADRFLDILETAPLKYQAFFKLALYGGFRAGEILGLRWDDIDFRLNIVQIKRTAHYSKALGHYDTTPKTKTSNRILKLPEHVIDTLQKLQVEQRNLYEFGGVLWNEETRVFTTDTFVPINSSTFSNWYKRTAEKNDLPLVSLHSFRHLNASLLINSGTDITTVASTLGHAQTTTTLNIYAHAFQKARAEALGAVANVLDNRRKKSG